MLTCTTNNNYQILNTNNNIQLNILTWTTGTIRPPACSTYVGYGPSGFSTLQFSLLFWKIDINRWSVQIKSLCPVCLSVKPRFQTWEVFQYKERCDCAPQQQDPTPQSKNKTKHKFNIVLVFFGLCSVISHLCRHLQVNLAITCIRPADQGH